MLRPCNCRTRAEVKKFREHVWKHIAPKVSLRIWNRIWFGDMARVRDFANRCAIVDTQIERDLKC